MGIYLPNMEMPNKKNGAVLIIYPDGKCAFEDGKTYQAVPVPPHGRLGDLDALYEVVKKRTRNWAGGWSDIECVLTGNDIKNAPTIIPAEPFNNLSKPCNEAEEGE